MIAGPLLRGVPPSGTGGYSGPVYPPPNATGVTMLPGNPAVPYYGPFLTPAPATGGPYRPPVAPPPGAYGPPAPAGTAPGTSPSGAGMPAMPLPITPGASATLPPTPFGSFGWPASPTDAIAGLSAARANYPPGSNAYQVLDSIINSLRNTGDYPAWMRPVTVYGRPGANALGAGGYVAWPEGPVYGPPRPPGPIIPEPGGSGLNLSGVGMFNVPYGGTPARNLPAAPIPAQPNTNPFTDPASVFSRTIPPNQIQPVNPPTFGPPRPTPEPRPGGGNGLLYLMLADAGVSLMGRLLYPDAGRAPGDDTPVSNYLVTGSVPPPGSAAVPPWATAPGGTLYTGPPYISPDGWVGGVPPPGYYGSAPAPDDTQLQNDDTAGVTAGYGTPAFVGYVVITGAGAAVRPGGSPDGPPDLPALFGQAVGGAFSGGGSPAPAQPNAGNN